MAKTVLSFDPVTSAYVGETIADDDQMQPGEVLHPAFTTEEPLPQIPDGHVAFWRGDMCGKPVNGQGWIVLRPEAPAHGLGRQESPQAHADRLRGLAQAHVDAAARALGYYNIGSAVTYADEPVVPKYQIEGQRLRRLRSLVWAEHESVMEEVTKGGEWPADDSYVARLPTYEEVELMENQEGTA